MKDLANAMKAARKACGLTLRGLAAQCGVGMSTISHIEHCQWREVSKGTVLRVSAHLVKLLEEHRTTVFLAEIALSREIEKQIASDGR